MTDQKRAKNVAVFGTILHLLFVLLLLIVWRFTKAWSPLPVLLFLAGGALLWLMLAVWFYCRQLARQEQRELEELAASDARSTTIFEAGQDAEARPAAARLAFFEKWINPAFTLAWALYQILIGAFLLRWDASREVVTAENPQQAAMFILIAAFAAFLLSRYATGMSSRPQWRPLRPAGAYLLMGMLLLTAMFVAMVCAWQGFARADLVVAFAVPVVQLVLAGELLINFVLDLYRPRIPGQEARVSYDSRLLGLIAEPQRVGHSIAETLNYQFGFEVSKTWFYRLVSRAFVPLLLFGALVLLALSCLVYVPPGTECVVLRYGRVDPQRPTLKPGLGFKLPWPVETVERFDVGRIFDLSLGLYPKGAKVTDASGQPVREAGEQPLAPGQRRTRLWKTAHGYDGRLEKDFIVPAYVAGNAPGQGNRAVIKLVVQVRYRIADVYKFGFGAVDGHKLLESLANEELIRYCSRVPLLDEFGFTSDRAKGPAPDSQPGKATSEASRELFRTIQAAVDARGVDLGVKIIQVGLVGIHPPEDAAEPYEAVLGAYSEREARLSEGRAQADRELSAAGGSSQGTQLLALSIRKSDQLGQLAAAKDAGAFDALAGGFITDTRDRMALVEQQRSQAMLRGRLDETAAAQALVSAHAAWRDELEALRAARKAGTADLASAIRAASAQTEALRAAAGGETAKKIAQARAFRWQKEIEEGALAKEFVRESLPYQDPATRKVYLTDRLCSVWEKVLPGAVKHVIGVAPERIESWLNYERPERSPLGPNFGPGETPGKK